MQIFSKLVLHKNAGQLRSIVRFYQIILLTRKNDRAIAKFSFLFNEFMKSKYLLYNIGFHTAPKLILPPRAVALSG